MLEQGYAIFTDCFVVVLNKIVMTTEVAKILTGQNKILKKTDTSIQ